MKTILPKLLFGSIFCCLSFNYPAWAESIYSPKPQSTQSIFLSAKVLSNPNYLILPLGLNLNNHTLNYSVSIDNRGYINRIISIDNWSANNNSLISNLIISDFKPLSLEKAPLTHQKQQGNLILGFQNTFWPSENNGQYWGLTAVKTWGTEGKINNLAQPNNPLPSLPKGSSAVTVSGGGKKNLVEKTEVLGEFADFRGGVAFQQGVSQDVTLGVGFVYENLLSGFSQLSYKPSNLPVKTSVSLMTGEDGVELHSHLNFKPSDNFVFNFYTDRQAQKFDLKWGIASGLTLTANGNSQDDSLSAGIKIAVKSDYFALSAIAKLNQNNEWQWNITSQFEDLKLAYASNATKSMSELSYDVLTLQDSGLVCSLFVNYENREVKNNEEYLATGGWRVASGEKFGTHQHRWQLNFGYGVGSQGTGVVASAATAISPDLFLKLSLQEVSVVSNELNFKLELGK
jgi:hypothetical protein